MIDLAGFLVVLAMLVGSGVYLFRMAVTEGDVVMSLFWLASSVAVMACVLVLILRNS